MATAQLDFRQKLFLPFCILKILIASIFIILAAPFRGENTPKSFNRHIKLSVTRAALSSISPQQLQSVAGSLEGSYLAWTKKQGLTPRSIQLSVTDTKAFWIGSPDAEHVVLFYHGGGWAMPGGDGHIFLASSLVERAKASGISASVLMLQYDLAPGAHYPRQLIQAVELLRYALDLLGKPPGRLTLMGDSAGANMIFGVLSHIMHPHPAIAPLRLAQPLHAAIICSPVAVLNTDNERFRTCEGQDPASTETIRIWLQNYLGPNKPDAWNQPLTNKAEWWATLDRAVDSVLVTAASHEMMAEDTKACVQEIQSVYENISLYSSIVDFHAEPTIGPALGFEECETARMMISFALGKLQ